MHVVGRVLLPLMALMALPVGVSAAPVTSWDLRLELGFVDWRGQNGLASSIDWAWDFGNLEGVGVLPGGATAAPQRLSWGGSDNIENQSRLQVEADAAFWDEETESIRRNVVRQGVQTGGEAVETARLTHINRPIGGDQVPLAQAVLLSQLWLTPGGVGEEMFIGSLAFNIQFLETPNNGACFAGSETNCDDIFVISGINFDLASDAIVRDFQFGGTSYRTFIGVTGLGPLSSEVCELATGSAQSCIGFTTPEGSDTSFQANLRIAALTQDVSVPGTLLLLSLGLVGLARRHRAV